MEGCPQTAKIHQPIALAVLTSAPEKMGPVDAPFAQNRIQARKEASENGSDNENTSDAGDSANTSLVDQDDETSNESGNDDSGSLEESSSNDSDQPPTNEATSISFGALAKAQEVLGKRRRDELHDGHDSSNIRKKSKADADQIFFEALERKAGKKDTRDFARTSKHAPAEFSSKKAVTRKREVIPTQKINYRDPRFEPLSGPYDEEKTRNKYSFLDGYRDSEINELKAAIRQTKDPEAKEKLKRALLSMESRKKSQQVKDQQQEVVRKHRKEEKAKVEQGKKPFYLKKTDQKQMALVKRFEGMKGKQVDKVIERRRKKQAGKEKKSMPEARRG